MSSQMRNRAIPAAGRSSGADPSRESRLRYLSGRIHSLGEQPRFELFRELDGGGALRSALDRYARIAPLAGFVAADGGDRLPQLRVVGGKE